MCVTITIYLVLFIILKLVDCDKCVVFFRMKHSSVRETREKLLYLEPLGAPINSVQTISELVQTTGYCKSVFYNNALFESNISNSSRFLQSWNCRHYV